jgi:hypothetical protein
MSVEKVMPMIEKLKPKLVEKAHEMMADGDSFETVAKWLSAEIEITVGREVFRKWFKKTYPEEYAEKLRLRGMSG